MLAAKIATVIGAIGVFILSIVQSIKLHKKYKGMPPAKRQGMRRIEKLNKQMKKLERDAADNSIKMRTVQNRRMTVRLETLNKLKNIDGMSDAEIEKHFNDLY